MSQIKGLEILSAIRYLRKQYGVAGYARIVENLSFVDQTIISETIKTTQWYDLQFFANLLDTADSLFGESRKSVHTLVARYAAEEAFKGIYKLLIRFMSPESLIKKAPFIWKQTDSTGELVIVEISAGHAVGRIINFEGTIKSYCLYFMKFCERVIELGGGKNVRGNELKCRANGDDYCEMEFYWD